MNILAKRPRLKRQMAPSEKYSPIAVNGRRPVVLNRIKHLFTDISNPKRINLAGTWKSRKVR
jgi:hypothetical protein